MSVQVHEELLKIAIETAEIGFWQLDLSSELIECSKECNFHLGLPFESILTYENLMESIHPEDRTSVEDLINQALEKSTSYKAEFRIIWPDKSVHWISMSGRALYGDDGKPYGMVGLTSDITEQKNTALAARERESYLQLIIDSTPVLIAYCDDQKRYRFVNKKYVERFEMSREEVIGKTIPEVVGEEAYAVFSSYVDAVLNGQPVEFELEIPYQGIGMHYMHCTYIPDVGNKGVVHGFIAVIADMTERKRAEIALRRSEERYRELFENAHDVVYTHDLLGNYTSVNRAGMEVTGYTPEEAKQLNFTQVVAPESIDKSREMLQRKLRGEENSTVYEVDIITKDKRRVTLELSTQLIYQDNKPIEVQGIGRDVTERKRIEEERLKLLEREQQARREAEEANRLKDEFLATISHELRTPLTSILGWANILRSQNIDKEVTAQGLETIERNARMQTQLIEDLLDISRVITGKLRLNMQPIDPAQIIDAAIESIHPAAKIKRVNIYKIVHTGPVLVSSDPSRLQQVIWNLLSNAIKFTPSGGEVRIRLGLVDSNVEIEVSDTGEGIPPDFLPFVFDRFRQADSSYTRKYGGLGLGLAIVRHLVELHGGTVEANSEGLGKGATFKIRLPLKQTYVPEQNIGDTQKFIPSSGRLERLDGLKILVTDDEPDTRQLLKMMLGRCGAEVVAVENAKDALDKLKAWKPDVMICDIGMPGEDGYELMKKIRSLPPESGGEVVALALTAYVRTEDKLKALKAGYQMHLAKPVDLPELTTVVANLANK
jgi:PAS domain S-box-containing protein